MNKAKKTALVLITLFLLTCVPAFAEDEVESSEVFVNSNALNSTITIKKDGESVSGPGNKVYALIETESTFDIVAEPVEGSELLALTMKIDDGSTVLTVDPIEQNGNVYTFKSPSTGGQKLTGEAYFGDPAEENRDTAKAATEEAAVNKITKEKEHQSVEQESAIVGLEEEPQRRDNKSIAAAEDPVLTKDHSNAQSISVADVSEVPNTGLKEIDMIPILLFTLILAGIVLVLRKKEM